MNFYKAIKVVEEIKNTKKENEAHALEMAINSMKKEWIDRERKIQIFMKSVQGIAPNFSVKEGGGIAAYEFLSKSANLPEEDIQEAGKRLGFVI